MAKVTEAAPIFLRNLLHLRYRAVVMTSGVVGVLLGSIVFYPGKHVLVTHLGQSVSIHTLALLLAVALVAGAIKGAIGFGYTLVATPIFASIINPTAAVVVLAIPPWMINTVQMGETATGYTYLRREWPLVLLALLGSVLGVYVFSTVSLDRIIPAIVGVLLLGYASFEVVTHFVQIKQAHHPIWLSIVGFFEGFLIAVANLGPLLPPYLHTFERDWERYIGGLATVVTLVFTARILQLALFTTALTQYRLWLGCVLASITLVGLGVGTWLRRFHLAGERVNWLITILIFCIGLNLVVTDGLRALTRLQHLF